MVENLEKPTKRSNKVIARLHAKHAAIHQRKRPTGIHRFLVRFPIGMLAAATMFDVVFVLSDTAEFALVSYYLIPLGLVLAALAIPFGIVDWIRASDQSDVKRHILGHASVALMTILTYFYSWLIRYWQIESPGNSSLTLSIIAFIGLLYTAWKGHQIVNRHSIGISASAASPSPVAQRRQETEHGKAA